MSKKCADSICEKRNNPFRMELEGMVQYPIIGTSGKKKQVSSRKLIIRGTKTPQRKIHPNKGKLFKEIQKIVSYWSSINSSKFNLDFDELYSQGLLITTLAIKSLDPKKGKLIDRVFNRVKRELYNYAKREASKPGMDEIQEWDIVSEITPELVASFNEMVQALNPVSQLLVKTLLSHPTEVFSAGLDNAPAARKNLVKKAQELHGNTVDVWYEGLKEIQNALEI